MFTLRLLDLGQQREMHAFLREALALIVEGTEARQGYLTLPDDQAAGDGWWIAHGLDDTELSLVRERIASRPIAELLARGQSLWTDTSQLVQSGDASDGDGRDRAEAVVCAPIGSDPPRGVLYLQSPVRAAVASDAERRRVDLFARHLAPMVDRVRDEHRQRQRSDSTSPLRATLRMDGVVGRSAALAATLRQAALVAPLDVHVLITGAPGTGKSQLARVIHDNGPRAQAPFVELNCAAIPETLFESELFGATQGAFTGADRRRDGKVRAAEGGTLLLDEIGELSPPAQAKLLQFLHSKTYYPLGATDQVSADVRIIAATNTDLARAVAEKRFREDLLFRLEVLPIRMPAVAERPEDIAELAHHFCRLACDRHRLPRLELSPGAVRALEAAEWPGNVRQIDHVVQAAAIRAAGEGVSHVELRHVFPGDAAASDEPLPQTFQEATRRFQQKLLGAMLVETDWNVIETARRLDLARSHVYNLIKAFGLERED